jgi:selenocysteine lyase/cysteine desulfurase
MTLVSLLMTDAGWFREQFPVFDQLAFMNAGSEGPIPRRAADAVQARLQSELREGRGGRPNFVEVLELANRVRAQAAGLFGCDVDEVALTGSTTDGVNAVVSGLDLGPGDEIVTSDEEHPGLLAPLALAQRRHGVSIRPVPWDELAGAVGPKTRLIACSHVSWVSGRMLDSAALAAAGAPVLLDGAQGLGAVPVDVRALGCDFYAASGQKWLCGPTGSGYLFVKRERIDELQVPWPSYGSLADPQNPLSSEPCEGAARFDLGFPAGIRSAWALASLELFEEAGWDWVHERGRTLAARLADALTDRGLDVSPRGPTTLVSWHAEDTEGQVERLREQDIVVRHLPGRGLIRASAGAWSSEEEVERLAQLAEA